MTPTLALAALFSRPSLKPQDKVSSDSALETQDLRPKTKSHHQGIANQTPALRCALFSTPPWSWSWLQNTAIITITKCPLPPLKKEEWPTFSFVLLEDTYINIVRTEKKTIYGAKSIGSGLSFEERMAFPGNIHTYAIWNWWFLQHSPKCQNCVAAIIHTMYLPGTTIWTHS